MQCREEVLGGGLKRSGDSRSSKKSLEEVLTGSQERGLERGREKRSREQLARRGCARVVRNLFKVPRK